MPGAEWLALLCKHIPDRYEHLVRYVGQRADAGHPALIEDPGVIRRILEHLGLWAPLATERSPPLTAASWPRHANLPLTYDPVPDIA